VTGAALNKRIQYSMIKEALSRLMFPLRMAIGFVVLLVLIRHVDFDSFPSLSQFQVLAICFAIVVLVSTGCIEAARLRCLTQNIYDFKTMVQTIFISAFITNFTPSNIGGDGYKVIKIGRQRGYTSATALVLLERGIGLGVLVAISIFFAFSQGGAWVDEYSAIGSTVDIRSYWNDFTKWLVIGVLGFAIVVVSIFRRAVRRLVSAFLEALVQLPASALVKVLALTLCFHIVRAGSLCGVLAVVDSNLEMSQAWVVLTFASVASLVPLSVGALGIREAAFVVALAPFSVATPEALFVGLVFRVASILQAAIGSILTFRGHSSLPKKSVSAQ
jgi:uncharacterized protein (TIRG00374 family)